MEPQLTEDNSVAGRPSRGMREHAQTLEHDANGERVVRSARAGQGAVKMRVYQHGVFFALGGAIGHADDDVGEVGVGLVNPFPHHVESRDSKIIFIIVSHRKLD